MTIVQDDHQATLRRWYDELQERRGDRASLRRSNTISDICLSEGFRSLLLQTHTLWKKEHQEWRITALALTAALAADIKTVVQNTPFAAQLGQQTGDKPVMSEQRFRRLSAVKDPDDLLRQLRRAVKLLRGNVNLSSLTEDIFHWCQEYDDVQNHKRRRQPLTDFITIRWALDYYHADEDE
ncbi:type I-E CRISPR-associated protein Cse2/CasB [Enterobacteriaceae bacterium ESL0689]|nr:type I-E CRISPR-associated protein Cse2/CasB [Enterobacteriaceae bacterium ESL0689]